jgi:excisionase family DNA binding protein
MIMADDVPVASGAAECDAVAALMPQPPANSEFNRQSRTTAARKQQPLAALNRESLPLLLTPREAASLLRVTPKAIYAMIERAQLPGVIRMGRRVRIDTRVLLHWLDRKCSPSPKENRR